jgi:hypothetical protein
MKFKLREVVEVTPDEKPVELWLEGPDNDGDVRLRARKGDATGTLLWVFHDGTMGRTTGLRNVFGFKTDAMGQVLENTE